METLSPLDAGFLELENDKEHLHIGSIAIFDGPQPSFEELLELVGDRMDHVPRARQRPQQIPLGLSRPVWVDDLQFDMREHIKHFALPQPGGLVELHELVSWFMSEPLALEHAPWMVWIVDGVAHNRWAVLTKVHHCMIDGIAGTELMAAMFDGAEESAMRRQVEASVAAGKNGRAKSRVTFSALPRPNLSLAPIRSAVEVARLAAPRTGSTLAGSLGRERVWSSVRIEIDDLNLIREAFGGTINDVCLAVLSRGYRDLMIHRGVEPSDHRIRSLVPVSVRRAGEQGDVGNRVSAMIADLPVDIADPVERLAATRSQLGRLKKSGEAASGELALTLARMLPAPLYHVGLSLAFKFPQRVFATVTTNVPGPRRPMYLAGRRLREMYPYVPIAFQLRTGIAMTSYDGAMYFGITADRDSTPDLDVMVSGIEDGLRELLKAAAEHQPATRGSDEG